MRNKKVHFEIEDMKLSSFMLDSIVSLLIQDDDFLKRFVFVVDENAFQNERYLIVKLCYDYFRQYNKAPKDHIVDLIDIRFEKKPKQQKLLWMYLDRLMKIEPNKEYVLSTFGEHMKKVICTNGITEANKYIERNSFEKAEQAIIQSFRDANKLTVNNISDFLMNGHLSLSSVEDAQSNFLTMIEPYDEYVGGFTRKEFVLVFGDTNVGKSFMMVHLTKAALLQRKKVLYITLETSEEIVKARIASALTATELKVGRKALKKQKHLYTVNGKIKLQQLSLKKLKKKLDYLHANKGRLWVHGATNFKFSDLVSMCDMIEVTEGVQPDLIILDSPDQMVHETSHKEERFNERHKYQRLLDFAKERNCTLVATTQATKQSSGKSIIRGKDVSEGYDKVRIPDTVITLSQTEQEYKTSKLRMMLAKSRTSIKYLVVEIYQALAIGQWALKCKKWSEEDAQAEAQKQMKEYGLNG